MNEKKKRALRFCRRQGGARNLIGRGGEMNKVVL